MRRNTFSFSCSSMIKYFCIKLMSRFIFADLNNEKTVISLIELIKYRVNALKSLVAIHTLARTIVQSVRDQAIGAVASVFVVTVAQGTYRRTNSIWTGKIVHYALAAFPISPYDAEGVFAGS